MKHLLTFIMAMLVGFGLAAQNTVLIVTQTDNCGFGGHSSAQVISQIQAKAALKGLSTIVVVDVDLIPVNIPSICTVVCVNTSGNMWDTPYERAFIQQFTGNWISFHAGAGDNMWHSSTNIDNCEPNYDSVATYIIGASLGKDKHENSSNFQIVYHDLIGQILYPQYYTGISDSISMQSEYYNISEDYPNAYWNPNSIPLYRVDRDGSGTFDCIVAWLSPWGISFSLGHASGNTPSPAAVPGTHAYAIWNRILDINLGCPTPFGFIEEVLLQEPEGEVVDTFTIANNIITTNGSISIYTIDGKLLIGSVNAELNLNNLADGYYVYKIQLPSGNQQVGQTIVR